MLIIATLFSAHSRCLAEEGNLLTNPGFEYGSSAGWTSWDCTLSVATDPVHSGDYSLLIHDRSESWQGPVQSLLGKLQDGVTYHVSAWVRLDNVVSDEIGITIRQTDSAGSNYFHVAQDTAYQDRWIELTGEFMLEINGSLTELILYIEGPAPGVNFYVDDIYLPGTLKQEEWKVQAKERIEQIRKRDAQLTVLSGTEQPLADIEVHIQQTRHDFAFGSVINDIVLYNKKYAQFFKDHFEWAVMENESKWYYNEPSQGWERYGTADGIYNFCYDNGIIMRGHCIFWAVDNKVQNWVKALSYAKLPAGSALWDAVVNRMNSVVTHFKGKFIHWDINNEMVPGSFFQNRLGKSVRTWMFEEAYRLDPNALLFVNEYNVINGGWSLEDCKQLTRDLIDSNAPVHGLGVQCHMSGGFDRLEVLARFDSVAELGLPVWVTEFDVSQAKAYARADDLEDFYTIAFSHPAVEGILMWGFWERSHWRANCHIVNANWTLNEAGRRYEQLLDNWTTDIDTVTDPNGQVLFRGFHGAYEVTLTPSEGQPVTTTVYLDPGEDPAVFTIEM
jgi:GH35 family endo-1,4-beta-xylanase